MSAGRSMPWSIVWASGWRRYRFDRDRLILPTEAINKGFALWDDRDRLAICNHVSRSLIGDIPVDSSFEDFLAGPAARASDEDGNDWPSRRAAAMPPWRAVIGLARELDLAVIAEDVETADQLALLRSFGCDKAQCFLLGRLIAAPNWVAPCSRPPERQAPRCSIISASPTSRRASSTCKFSTSLPSTTTTPLPAARAAS